MAPTVLCTYVVKHAQGYSVLGPTSKKGKQTCTNVTWTATRGMHFSTPPSQPRQGVATYSTTVQVQPVRATTPLALSWKKRGQKTRKRSDPSGWSGSPCALLRVVSGAPVALLAHLVLDKPVRVCQRGTGLSAVEFGPLGCCKEARWSSTCLFTLGAGCL